MAPIAQEAHLPALDHHRRDEVGRELQATLVELVGSWRGLSDTVAERAVALGFSPDGQAGTVSADSEIPAVERGTLAAGVVVRELVRRLADVSERTRERMDRLGELDLASEDVLIEVLRALEKQLWMLPVQLDREER